MRWHTTERGACMGRTIGYARVSTPDQDVSLQLDALRQAGCAEEQIFLHVASGTYTTSPGLEACLQALAPTFLNWKRTWAKRAGFWI